MTMAADCEQARARMLELLYGELGPDARAEVDAHVAGCASCKPELAALQSTRALVRGRLTADSPPPRARAAILQAAAAAVPTRKTVTAPAAPSFWTRIRAKWTLPTFATIGAVAVFLLASRIFMEPEKTYQRGRQGLAPPPTEAPASAPSKNELEAERPARSAEKPEAPAATATAGSAAERAAHHNAHAKKAAPGNAMSGKREQPVDDLMAAPAPPPPRAAAPRQFAPEPKRPAKGAISDDFPEGLVEQPASKEKSAPSGGGAGLRSRPAADEPAPSRAAREAADEGEAPRARETPAQRADRLFAQRRWVEAAVAYRELLRDQPRSPDAERWRTRLAACNAALSGQP